MNSGNNHYETPFSDQLLTREEPYSENLPAYHMRSGENENPFVKTFEISEGNGHISPFAGEIAQLLGDLQDAEFSQSLYELVTELEDSWQQKISNEAAMGDQFLPFVRRQASGYLNPLIKASEGMIDRISKHISGNTIADMSANEIGSFLNEYQPDPEGLTPVQEQFLGSVFKKVKNAVQAGINLAGKFLPVNIILDRLKGLMQPLFERVMRFAIGKLPANLQPFAKTLAKKLFNLETAYSQPADGQGEIDTIQAELNLEIANLLYNPDESEARHLVMEYEAVVNDTNHNGFQTGTEINAPSLQAAREQLMNELRQLQTGEDPTPAIERFLPVAIMALKPVIKMGISVIGRPKVINFLAGLLAKLISRYVPQNVVQPLAASIIDAGMTAIGFETYEMNKPDIGYEALINTIEDTVQNLQELDETQLADEETLTVHLLEAFETAAVNNFPPRYIKEELRPVNQPGVWVVKPRNGFRPAYKKYTTVFSATIDPQKAKNIFTFRDLPLSGFLQDKLGLDPAKTVTARVHLFEAIKGSRLSQINKHENLPGLNPSVAYSWVQFHPLSKQAASVLLNNPSLGRDVPKQYTTRRYNITTGQRFYYLEIEGARLRMKSTAGNNKPPHSDDVRGTLNFVKSSLTLSYYFSEEHALSMVSKLNQNDFTGVASELRNSLQGVFKKMLTGNVSGNVKIIHEAFPEQFAENYEDNQEQFLGIGKNILSGILENIVKRLAGKAYDEVRDYFRSRAAEFKQAQAQPEDGVTIRVTWSNIAGLSTIKSLITALREGKLINPASISFPNLSKPEITVSAGKNLD
jgi:hypothetical protein